MSCVPIKLEPETAWFPIPPADLTSDLPRSGVRDVCLLTACPPPDFSCPKTDFAEPRAHLPLEVTA